MTKVGNVLPMVEVADTEAARAGGALPARAWAMLDLARAAGHAGARLTWCAGWGQVEMDDPSKPPTPKGNPGRTRYDVITESLALRVPGLLWVAWERPAGRDWRNPPDRKPGKGEGGKVTPTAGQMRVAPTDGGGVRACTVAAAERLLRAQVKEREQTRETRSAG